MAVPGYPDRDQGKNTHKTDPVPAGSDDIDEERHDYEAEDQEKNIR